MIALYEATYPLFRAETLVGVEQDGGEGSFHLASEIESASRLDLEASYRCRDLINLLRARTFSGRPGCLFEDSGRCYEISISIRENAK